jgi:precorrin-2/cobalt-factor-2 C20-methyltransferase
MVSSAGPEMRRGRLYGVGVGPGDPELITLKVHRLLTTSPVICVPKRNLKDDGYAGSIVKQFLQPEAQEILSLEFPMTRDWERLKPYWDQNTAEVWARLERGLDCVFITEGDPFMYSTFIYIYEYMRQQHPEVEIEVVPGISSFLAAAARVGMPLANKYERIAIIPDVADEADARRVLEQFDTVVFLKVNSVFEVVYAALESLDLVDRARFVKKVTAPGLEEVVADIRTLRGQKLEYLSLLLVRKSHGG